MSNLAKALESECRIVSGCDALKRIISPKSRDLGGFSVKRILPSREVKSHAKLLIGSAFGRSSPVKTFSETLYAEVRLSEGKSIQLPNVEELALYVVEGNLKIGSVSMADHHMAVFSEDQGITVTAQSNARCVLIGGEPLGRRFIDWNFVATDKSLIEDAKQRWLNEKFPAVPGDSEEYIPLP